MAMLEKYLKTISFEETKRTVEDVTKEIFGKHLASFDYRSNVNGLLLGEVQSGKTGQMFGVIASAVDKGFDIFVVLTTDNKRLQQQTFRRALDSFSADFCVCDETDDIRFKMNKMRQPVIIVLKKNTSILKKWRNELVNSNLLSDRPLFIIDDEADAASLNTKVNKNDISTINKNIREIRDTAHSCVYLQVTATPQAVLLQAEDSEFKPSFVTYFKPGKSYLGGDFFFSKPESYCIKYVDEEEIKDIKDPNSEISKGLAQAVIDFLIVCANMKLSGEKEVCNFLIHPSVRISEHQTVAVKIGQFLNDLLRNIEDDDEEERKSFECEWMELHSTKPEIKKFHEIYPTIKEILFNNEVNPTTLNSQSDAEQSFEEGFNIVVGGNTLGRGVTFPNLQIVYYSRTAKTPQADTFWQHCRMFGYDRDRGLIRLYMPPFIHKLFQELNNSQTALVKQITTYGIENTHLLYIDGVRPTRKNVVKNEKLCLISGGVNYFAAYPENINLEKLDSMLLEFNGKNISDVFVDFVLEVLEYITSSVEGDWNSRNFINAVKMLSSSENIKKCKLLVSDNHNLSAGTGTMLSPTDRELTEKCINDILLVMYRVNGEKEKGWKGQPFWMPNIKLPESFCLYKME